MPVTTPIRLPQSAPPDIKEALRQLEAARAALDTAIDNVEVGNDPALAQRVTDAEQALATAEQNITGKADQTEVDAIALDIIDLKKNSRQSDLARLGLPASAFINELPDWAYVDDAVGAPTSPGVIDITAAPYNADPTGVADSTPAFVLAMQNRIRTDGGVANIVQVPPGTYRLAASAGTAPLIEAITSDGAKGSSIEFRGHGPHRTILKLDDNAPGFGDRANPRQLFRFWGANNEANRAFYNSLQDLTIDCGDNPGCIAVKYGLSNRGGGRGLVIEGNGAIGIDVSSFDTGPGLFKDVIVRGFHEGVVGGSQWNGVSFDNVQVLDYTRRAFITGDQVFTLTNCKTKGETMSMEVTGSQGCLFLDQCEIDGSSAAGTGIRNLLGHLSVRNTKFKGVNTLAIDNPGGTSSDRVTVLGEAEIKFYSSHGQLGETDNLSKQLQYSTQHFWYEPKAELWANAASYQDGNRTDAQAWQLCIDRSADHPTGMISTQRKLFTVDEVIKIGGDHGRNVRAISFNESIFRVATIDTLPHLFEIGETDYDVLYIEALGVEFNKLQEWTDNVIKLLPGAPTLVLRNSTAGVSSSIGAQDVYVYDCKSLGYASEFFEGQRVFYFNADIEKIWTPSPTARIISNGAKVYVNGFHTERLGTVARAKNGGAIQIVGGQLEPRTPGDDLTSSAFVVEDSAYLDVSMSYTQDDINPDYVNVIEDVVDNTLIPQTGLTSKLNGWFLGRYRRGATFIDPPVTLAAPTNVATGTVTENSIETTFDAVVNATTYVIQGRLSGGTYATLSTLTGPRYTHRNLAAATSYDYRVRAENGPTKGPWVELLNVSTLAATVRNLTASSSNITPTSADVTFTPTFDATVKYAVVETSRIAGLDQNQLRTLIDQGLLNTAPSYQNLAIAFDGLQLTASGSFSDSDGDTEQGTTIQLQESTDGTTWTTIDTPLALPSTYLLAYSDDTKQYRVRVVARAEAGIYQGNEQFSPVATFSSPDPTPEAATNFVVTVNSETQHAFSWDHPGADEYVLHSRPLGTADAYTFRGKTTDGSTTLISNQAVAGENYQYRLIARNIVDGVNYDSAGVFQDAYAFGSYTYNTADDLATVQAGNSDRWKIFEHPNGAGGATRVPWLTAYIPEEFYANPTKKFPIIIQTGGDGSLLSTDATATGSYTKARNFGYLKEARDDASWNIEAIVICTPYKYYGGATMSESVTLRDNFVTQFLQRIHTDRIGVTGQSGSGFINSAEHAILGTYKAATIMPLGKRANATVMDLSLYDAIPVWFVVNEDSQDFNSAKGTYDSLVARNDRGAVTRFTQFVGTGHNAWLQAFDGSAVTLTSFTPNSPINPPSLLDFVNEWPLGTVPNLKPTITVTPTTRVITEGDPYVPPTVTANDPETGDITANIVTAGDTVDPNTVGVYTVTYNVADPEGGTPADEKTHTVTVQAVGSGGPAIGDTVTLNMAATNGNYVTNANNLDPAVQGNGVGQKFSDMVNGNGDATGQTFDLNLALVSGPWNGGSATDKSHADGVTFQTGQELARSEKILNADADAGTVDFSATWAGLDSNLNYALYSYGERQNSTFDQIATMTVAGTSRQVNSKSSTAVVEKWVIPPGSTQFDITILTTQSYYINAFKLVIV